MDLTGRRILLTGATGVLGGLIAQLLAERGATLALSGRDDARLAALAVPGERYAVDLNHPGAAAALIAAARADGPIDGVVIAHGVVAFGGVSALDDAALSRLMQLNQTGPIQLVHEALPALIESSTAGKEPFVVTISGVISELPTLGMAGYGASKAGLLHFVKAAQRELKRAGIRLLDARPPHTETGLATRAISGAAPTMPTGIDPMVVASRIVAAIDAGEIDVPTSAFTVS